MRAKDIVVAGRDLRLIDALLERVDRSRDAGPEILARTVTEVVGELRALASGANPAVDYAVGYALYAHPDRLHDDSIRKATDEALLRAANQAPADGLPWLYLGHNAYDAEEYAEALARFRRACERLEGHFWLRAREMMVCCQIKLVGLAGALLDLEVYVQAAENAPKEDIWPVELAACLKVAGDEIPVPVRARLRQLCQRLDAVGHFGDWFAAIIGKRGE